jgi:hypothetical protein
MNSDLEPYLNIWEMLLSRRPGVIRKTFDTLDTEEQHAVLDHLRRMVSESGWQPEQRESARAALEAIREIEE